MLSTNIGNSAKNKDNHPQEQKTRKKDYIAKELHSTYISEIEIYKADQSVSAPKIIPWDEREIVSSDDKLMRIIAKIKSDAENSSKIADENGEPLAVYHGTMSNEPFHIFEKGDVGFHFGTEEQAKDRATDEKSVMNAYLNIRNPLVIPQDIGNWNGKNMTDYILSGDIDFDITEDLRKAEKDIETLEKIAADTDSDGYNSSASKAMREFLKAKGYDGIQYLNSFEGDKDTISWIAFDSTQIKSATDNIGTFDGTNPDIRFSLTSNLDLGDTSLSPEDYRRSIAPLFDFVMEYTDGVVNPGPDYIGEDFDSSYISEAYNKFSAKRKHGKKESNASYQRYLHTVRKCWIKQMVIRLTRWQQLPLFSAPERRYTKGHTNRYKKSP